MKKTTVYLEPELDHALGRLAAKHHVSKAEVIRSALRDAARQVERPRITGIGLAHGPGDVADNIDRHLAETSFGSK
ncbi:MAG TPA: CopG family transcriptional regulator [Patescibacteria group bacterium]|nr:CopG family transcriptional regulator [Patescibacteria group bacterium]